MKQFTGSKKSEGGSTSQLISLAMAEATKLFDKSGASSGNKQDAVNGAAMTVMKLLVQSKFSGATGGGDSGGLSSLMGLVSDIELLIRQSHIHTEPIRRPSFCEHNVLVTKGQWYSCLSSSITQPHASWYKMSVRYLYSTM